MALIVKAQGQRDLGYRRVRFSDFLASLLYSEPPDKFADRAIEVLAKHSRQVNGMYSYVERQLSKRRCVGHSRTKRLFHVLEPSRHFAIVLFRAPARKLSDCFQQQSFDRKRGPLIPVTIFVVQTQRE